MSKITYKTVAINDIHAHPDNARRGNIDLIRQSLRKHGQYRPLVVQKSTGTILAGTHTWLAAQAEGIEQIDIGLIDVDDEQARRILLVDNKANDEAGYDDEALAKLLRDLDGDYDATGFAPHDLDALLDSLSTGTEQADKMPKVAPPSRTSAGETWVLGDHLLYVGDALEADSYAAVLAGSEPNLVVTSPPYNQKLDSFKPSGMGKRDPTWTKWIERMASAYEDSKPEGEYQAEQIRLLNLLHDYTAPGAAVFYNHKVRIRNMRILSPMVWLMDQNQPWGIRQEIVWDRQVSITFNARMFIPRDERIYWLVKDDEWIFNDTTDIKSYGSVWSIAPRTDPGVEVTAPFPVELPKRCIEGASVRGGLVLDPYGGSGTTLIACEVLGRRCATIEINSAYADVVIARWEALTGRTAEPEG